MEMESNLSLSGTEIYWKSTFPKVHFLSLLSQIQYLILFQLKTTNVRIAEMSFAMFFNYYG